MCVWDRACKPLHPPCSAVFLLLFILVCFFPFPLIFCFLNLSMLLKQRKEVCVSVCVRVCVREGRGDGVMFKRCRKQVFQSREPR